MTTDGRDLCSSNKRRWTTLSEVERWLGEYRRTKHPKAPRMKAYTCTECGGFHVTHWQSWTAKKARKGSAW